MTEEPGTAVQTGADDAAPTGDERVAALLAGDGEATPPPGDGDRAAAATGDDATPDVEEAVADAPADGDRAADDATADEAVVGQPTEEADAVEEEPPAEPARSGNGVPAQPPADLPPTTVPRATPRPQPKPKPAAAPLRASTTRTATPPPQRRTSRRSQRDESSRTGLYTLIGIVVLAIAIFVPVYFMVLAGDDPAPPPNPIAEPGGTPSSESGAGGRAVAERPEKVVVVLNGTSIDGLASRERDTLMEAGYADGMIRIDNSDDQARQDSLVLYEESERRQARDVARLLDISRMEVIDDETQALADSSDESGTLPADVVVMLGTDKSP